METYKNEDAHASAAEEDKPFHETATPEQWIDALRAWAASHKPGAPLLSDEAVERDSIYAGRAE
jgi:hypothetical protein